MRKSMLTAAVACVAGTMFSMPFVQGREPDKTETAGQPSAQPVAVTPGSGHAEGRNADDMPSKEMDKHFVMFAANTNLEEIEGGKYAADHVSSPDVKKAAEMMVMDHQKAQDELVAIGKSANVDVPTELDELHQKKVAHLQSMKGKHFERAFVYHNVADHQLAVLMFRDAAQELQSPELRKYAAEQLPVLRQHLAEAEKLAGMSSGEAHAASDKIPADKQSPTAASDNKTPVSSVNNGIQSNQGGTSGRDTAEKTSGNASK